MIDWSTMPLSERQIGPPSARVHEPMMDFAFGMARLITLRGLLREQDITTAVPGCDSSDSKPAAQPTARFRLARFFSGGPRPPCPGRGEPSASLRQQSRLRPVRRLLGRPDANCAGY